MSARIYLPKPGPETMRRETTGGGSEHQVGCLLQTILHTTASIASIALVIWALDFWLRIMEVGL